MNLLIAKKNKNYKVKSIKVEGKILKRLEALGIIEGTRIEILSKDCFGLMLIKIRGTRIGIEEKIAFKIYVEEDNQI